MTEKLLMNVNNCADDRDEINKIMKKNIAIEIKNNNQWLIENTALCSEIIMDLYIEVLRDTEKFKETTDKKNIFAVDPDGNEKTYTTIYRASKELEIHPSIISCCCKGERYMRSGKFKKDGKSLFTMKEKHHTQETLKNVPDSPDQDV